MNRPRIACLLALLGVATTSCGTLEPRPDPTQFYVLTTLTESGQPPTKAASLSASVIVGLGPIIVPKYLDRPEIVRRTSANQVEISDYERWAEPFADGVVRVLSTDLSLLLQPARLVLFPWAATIKPTYEIRVVIERFEATADGKVDLVARWGLRTDGGRKLVSAHDTIVSRPLPSSATADAVATMSAALGELSTEIALAVRRAAAP